MILKIEYEHRWNRKQQKNTASIDDIHNVVTNFTTIVCLLNIFIDFYYLRWIKSCTRVTSVNSPCTSSERYNNTNQAHTITESLFVNVFALFINKICYIVLSFFNTRLQNISIFRKQGVNEIKDWNTTIRFAAEPWIIFIFYYCFPIWIVIPNIVYAIRADHHWSLFVFYVLLMATSFYDAMTATGQNISTKEKKI